MCSKFNHTHCGRTCSCAVACLRPRNSISNVVVSVTIDDDTDIYLYIYIYIFQIFVNVYVYVYLYVYVYVHVYVYVYVKEKKMSMFRDLESGLSKDLKDGERGLRRANAGGGSWRY